MHAILGDWKSNNYVSGGRVNKIVGVWEKQILRLLEHPEERGRIYLVWMDLANDSLVDWIKGVASSR